ncbi:MAG TPA: type 1 glutamine amidotransferase [Kineosporiaceae bacterium]|nr:type 1 glutamine amidotransferase [Kineosporiaceae bacterium]
MSATTTDPITGGPAEAVRPHLLVIQHQDDGGLGRLRAPFAATTLDVRRPDRGEPLPDDLDGVGGLVVLGGSMAAWEDDVAPWLPQTRRLLALGVETRVPVLGICLGAQLLAHATGGRVERGAHGIEAGLSAIVPTADAEGDPLMAALPAAAFPGPQGHHDAIVELPPGAVLVATGHPYPHQAFRLGATAWGVQYHPEVTAEDFAGWMREDAPLVVAAGIDPFVAARAVLDADEELDELAAAHATGFLGVVTGSSLGARR